MSHRAIDDGHGKLTIRNFQHEDAGVYVCTGSDFASVVTDEAVLTLGGKRTLHMTACAHS